MWPCHDCASSDDSFVSFVYIPVQWERWAPALFWCFALVSRFGRVRCGGIALVGLAFKTKRTDRLRDVRSLASYSTAVGAYNA